MPSHANANPLHRPPPPPTIYPPHATTLPTAIHAVTSFLSPPSPTSSSSNSSGGRTLLLTGAGLSTPSGLADYRGAAGTYTLNRSYRPIYHHEFLTSHESRKRYWARSFLGFPTLARSRPNRGHYAIQKLGERGWVSGVVTQNVDSFHPQAHPGLQTVELHGYLRSCVCVTCHAEIPRADFQGELARLNPTWAGFLEEMVKVGAMESEDPAKRREKGLRANPDGDVDVPGAPYTTFRYPACPSCLASPPVLVSGERARVEVDGEGGMVGGGTTGGVLKPAVVMFGESIPEGVKKEAEGLVDAAERVLVVGSSLATYSAWRLVRRAREGGKGVGVVNLGGVRGEEGFFAGGNEGGVRVSERAEVVLEGVVEMLERGKVG